MPSTYPADLVNPMIGTISHLLVSTVPMAMLPHGAAKTYPLASSHPDYFCNSKTCGFPIGKASLLPGTEQGFAEHIDHSRATYRCYAHRIEMEDADIVVEATVTHHGYLYRFTGARRLLLRCTGGELTASGAGLRIRFPLPGAGRGAAQYVLLLIGDGARVHSTGVEQAIITLNGDTECRAAVSYLSFDRAEQSLALELKGRAFETVSATARDIWNNLLGRVRVTGNTHDKQVVFYTALYRAFQRMTDYSEHGAYFGYDGESHEGAFFYTGDGLWDTFRCMHPLQLLLDTRRQADIVESYNLMYRQSGLMPSFPAFGVDAPVMIGFHAAPLFLDSYVKNLPVDYQTAYAGIRKNALTQSMLPWHCNTPATALDRCYMQKGFFPALKKGETESETLVHKFEKRQAVSVTLEHAYDDWCVAQLALHLKHEEDYRLFSRRALNYKNLYHPELGFMAPKSADGAWVEGFHPKWSGGAGGRDYFTENNTWTYTWSVLHDPEGLAALMGGKEAAVQRLDALFAEGFNGGEGNKYGYLAQYPDATGLMGQFAMGNEPSFHIPYLYDYFGCPWKAQKRLRDLMDIWFTNSPTGICGDEDGGAMSSWFVFSALGFYPVCPGKPDYAIGTPLFDSVEIKLENGNVFAVESPGAGEGKRYIQSAVLNGAALKKPFLSHDDIMAGGTLRLMMGEHPNTQW